MTTIETEPTEAEPAEPMTAADLLRPTDWDGYIGQTALKERLQVHILSALRRKVPMEHVLLAGPPGSGKTTLAGLVAKELGDPIYVAVMPLKDADFRNLRGYSGVLFLDEIHRGSKSEQEDLMPLLEHGFMRPKGNFRMDFTWLTVIMATTEPGRVLVPLADKATIQPPFDEYSDDEMATIAKGMAAKLELVVSDTDALVYGKAATGVPRKVSHLVQAARDIQVAKARPVTGAEVLEFLRLTSEGLAPTEVQYLHILYRMDAPVGLMSMRQMLDCDEASVRNIERPLIRLNLILKSARGRELSEEGYRRANELFGDYR